MFRRGFKTWCENIAASLRTDFKLPQSAPLDPVVLSNSLSVALLTPDDIPGIAGNSRRTLEVESDSWSAVTVSQGDKVAIVYNPAHSPGRNSNDIMHELAHIILDHDPAKIVLSADTLVALRTFDDSQEEEASWLSGALLLPRSALLAISRSGKTDDDACDHYRVSIDLLKYRRNITGVSRQLRYSKGMSSKTA